VSDKTKVNYIQTHLQVTSYILIALSVCLWRDNFAFSFYGRTGQGVVVTSVCDGARVCHRRPTGPGSTLSDSRIFTDWARRGGCRAGSVTEGRPGLEWYLFTSTIRIRPNFNLMVKTVFLPTRQCFSLSSLSKRMVRIWYISPHPTATNHGVKRTVPSKKFQKSPIAKVGPISLTYLFERIKIDRYGCVQFLIRQIEIREGKYFFKNN
jgi:hypothetical protein